MAKEPKRSGRPKIYKPWLIDNVKALYAEYDSTTVAKMLGQIGFKMTPAQVRYVASLESKNDE